MLKRDDAVLLRDILDAISQIEVYLADVSFRSFCETPLLQDGVMHRLEIIEAVSRQGLTAAPSNAHPSVAQAVHFRCQTHGGHGAFREFAEWLLGTRRGADTGRRES